MPETTFHKHREPRFAKNEIRFAWQRRTTRQPVMPWSRSKSASRCSVLTLPALRIFAINALRFALVRTSTMFTRQASRR